MSIEPTFLYLSQSGEATILIDQMTGLRLASSYSGWSGVDRALGQWITETLQSNLQFWTKRSTFHDLFDECRAQSGELLKGTFAPDAVVYDGDEVRVCGDVLSTTNLRKIAWSNGVALIPAKTVDPTTGVPLGYIAREVRSYEEFEDFA